MKIFPAVVLAVCCAQAHAAPPITIAPFSSFDGKSWSGLTIGTSTDSSIKKQFAIAKGAIRPEALRLMVAAPVEYRVDALLDDRGSKARLAAIRIEALGAGSTVKNLVQELGETPKQSFPIERFEDWSVFSFEKRGITVFAIGPNEMEVAKVIVMTHPIHVPQFLTSLTADKTQISEYDPKFSREDLTVRFDRPSVNIRTSNASVDRRSSVESDAQADLMRRTYGEFLRYDYSGSGTMSCNVDVRWDSRRRELNIEATVSASGRNALGDVRATGSDSRTWRDYDNRPNLRNPDVILNIIDNARRECEQNFDDAVRKQRPPSKEEIRNSVWNQIINSATKNP